MRKMNGVGPRALGLALAFGLTATYAGAATCDGLKSLTLPQATIDSAEIVGAGAFTQPGGRAGDDAVVVARESLRFRWPSAKPAPGVEWPVSVELVA